MVDTQLRPQGVSFPPLVDALAKVAREEFVTP
jgi:protein-L-isoaspartate O-methyltransferase